MGKTLGPGGKLYRLLRIALPVIISLTFLLPFAWMFLVSLHRRVDVL